ncbi:MAG TPA: hypothetical protein PLQ12_06360, partial [Candidatus Defluviicoccus seviourii]|nr:hypothetical protein [Candidatus Defluviicoccus seviourii]
MGETGVEHHRRDRRTRQSFLSQTRGAGVQDALQGRILQLGSRAHAAPFRMTVIMRNGISHDEHHVNAAVPPARSVRPARKPR